MKDDRNTGEINVINPDTTAGLATSTLNSLSASTRGRTNDVMNVTVSGNREPTH